MHRPIWADTVNDMNTADLINQARSQGTDGEVSINALAEMTLIPRITLQRKLAGNGDFTVTEVRKIAKALGVSTPSLVDPEVVTEASAA